jgi:hypothetical protein
LLNSDFETPLVLYQLFDNTYGRIIRPVEQVIERMILVVPPDRAQPAKPDSSPFDPQEVDGDG